MCSCSRSSSLEKEWSYSPRWIHPPPSSDDDVDLEKGTRSGVSARLFSPPTLKKGAVSHMCVYVFSLSLLPHFVCFVRILLLLLCSYIRNHSRKKRSKNEELSSLFVSSYKNRRKTHHQIMGGKTELTTIKTLMEITGQNKEDVQSVLQKFGGDEALAVSELMCSACNHHLSYFNFSRAGGKIIVREALCGIITRAKTDPLRLFFPKLQCISSWT